MFPKNVTPDEHQHRRKVPPGHAFIFVRPQWQTIAFSHIIYTSIFKCYLQVGNNKSSVNITQFSELHMMAISVSYDHPLRTLFIGQPLKTLLIASVRENKLQIDLLILIFVDHSVRQQHFRMLFACQTQWNLHKKTWNYLNLTNGGNLCLPWPAIENTVNCTYHRTQTRGHQGWTEISAMA